MRTLNCLFSERLSYITSLNCICHVVHYILTYLTTGSLYPLTAPPNSSHPNSTYTNHKFDLFVSLFLKYNWPTALLVSIIQYSDQIISLHFKMITTIGLVTICHHTKILLNYRLYFEHCTFHTHDLFILQL